MALPLAWELHAARELILVGGPFVLLGGVIGGVIGAANPEGKSREEAFRQGVAIGCALVFLVLLVIALT